MSPFAGYFYYFQTAIAGTMAFGAFTGAFGGAIVWMARARLLPGAVVTFVVYAIVQAFLSTPRDRFTFVAFGVLPMVLTFLTALVVARQLEVRIGLRRIWAALAALGIALCVGFADVLLVRVRMWAPHAVALVAGIGLALVLMRSRGQARSREHA